jgi:hypothetical protein
VLSSDRPRAGGEPDRGDDEGPRGEAARLVGRAFDARMVRGASGRRARRVRADAAGGRALGAAHREASGDGGGRARRVRSGRTWYARVAGGRGRRRRSSSARCATSSWPREARPLGHETRSGSLLPPPPPPGAAHVFQASRLRSSQSQCCSLGGTQARLDVSGGHVQATGRRSRRRGPPLGGKRRARRVRPLRGCSVAHAAGRKREIGETVARSVPAGSAARGRQVIRTGTGAGSARRDIRGECVRNGYDAVYAWRGAICVRNGLMLCTHAGERNVYTRGPGCVRLAPRTRSARKRASMLGGPAARSAAVGGIQGRRTIAR